MAHIKTNEQGQKYISNDWHVEDVLHMNSGLTQEQAEKVLELIVDTHDATIGINWDVIQAAIETLGYED